MDAVRVSLHMCFVGLVGLALYKYLKSHLVRQRPYIQHGGITLGAAPLDLYSFPSGHTLHAVTFTMVALVYYPQLAWLLIPFASLVAMSRVILGLHYPRDVFAGAVDRRTVGAGKFHGVAVTLLVTDTSLVKPMRILFITDVFFPRVNGVSTSLQTFWRELEALGHEVKIIAPDYGQQARRALV